MLYRTRYGLSRWSGIRQARYRRVVHSQVTPRHALVMGGDSSTPFLVVVVCSRHLMGAGVGDSGEG